MTAIFGFTNFGGIFQTLFNLYLLRLGYGPEFIGQVSAVGSLALVFTCLPAGALERRWGSRNLIIGGLFLNILGGWLLPLAEFISAGWQQGWILSTYALNSIGLALFLVNSQPFLAGATSVEERGHAFSVQGAIWPLSGFAGSLLAGFMPGFFASVLNTPLEGPVPYRFPLLISATASLLALWAMLQTRQKLDERKVSGSGKPRLVPYGIIALIATLVMFQVAGEGATRTFTNVYLDARLGLATARIGLLLGAGQLAAVPAALLTPLLATRLGKEKTFIGASLGMAFSMLPLALIPAWIAAGLGFMGLVMMASIARPVIMTIQMEVVSPAWRAAMSSVTTMMASLSMGMMSFLGGFIIPAWGYPTFFLIGAALTASAAVFYWIYLHLNSH